MSAGYEPSEPSPSRGRIILAISLITVAILAWVSLHARAGTMGAWAAGQLRTLFGKAADLPPFFVLWAGLRLIFGSLNRRWWRRCLGALVLLGVLFVALEIAAVLPLPPAGRLELAGMFWSSQAGVVGGWLARQFLELFGLAGTAVICAGLSLMGLVLLLEPAAWARLAQRLFRIVRGLVGLVVALIQGIGEGVDGVRRLFHARRARRGQAVAEQVPPGRSRQVRRRARWAPAPAGTEEEAPEDTIAFRPSAAAAREEAVQEDEEDEELEESSGGLDQSTRGGPRSARRRLRARYRLPDVSLLRRNRARRSAAEEPDRTPILEETLRNFGIDGRVVEVIRGPVVTRYEVQPPPGIKVSRIVSLADDIALALAAVDVRIEAPVPGKSVVGIEVPNRTVQPVYLRDVIESEAFRAHPSPVAVALGLDITGQPVVADLAKLVHLLIAGATGSGKSVCLNGLLVSLLFRAQPDEVRLLLI
ncbi:MAG TPA: DNA translocase FtsK 4TM domain-containing protein, partial [Limnochorda sp.]